MPIWLVALFACRSVAGTARIPPPTLEVGPAADGLSVAFTVHHVLPGETVDLTWSLVGPGIGPCPVALAGTCVDLVDPRPVRGPATGDLSGTATFFQTWLHPSVYDTLWAQAFVHHADGTVTSTAVVERPIFDIGVVLDTTVTVTDEADLLALAGVAAITGDLRIEGTALGTVDLPDLRQIGGDLVIWENDALVAATFPALEIVGGDLSLYDDPLLPTLGGFSAVRSVGGTLSVNRMPAIVDLLGLEAVETIGALYLFHDTALVDTDGLAALREVAGAVELWELYALQTVNLPAVEAIGGRIDLFDADQLTAITLPVLTGLGGYELHECGAMTDVGSFPALRSIDGYVTLQYDDALVSVAGFAEIATVGGLTVRFDGALGTLSGLSSLTAITGTLEVDHLDGPASIDLPALQSVGSLRLDHDDGLVDPGLPALTEIVGDAVVIDNLALPHCALDTLFDRVTVGGVVTCGNNFDDGCLGWCVP